MVKKEVLFYSLIVLLFFSLIVIVNYKNSSLNIVAYSVNELKEEDIVDINNIQFFNDMRFSRKILSYKIDSSCNETKRERMKNAFDILKNRVEVINFIEVETKEDIFINCVDYQGNISEGYIKVGEGGAYSIIDTGKFHLIREGKISLYNSSDSCDIPNIELHELLHVLGFKHSEDNKSIMYNISSCNQNITEDITNKLIALYTLQEIPDLVFENLSSRRGFTHADFSVDVINSGLREAKNVSIEIDYGNSESKMVLLEDFEIGEKKRISAENFRVNKNKKITLKIKIINDLNINDNSLYF